MLDVSRPGCVKLEDSLMWCRENVKFECRLYMKILIHLVYYGSNLQLFITHNIL